jgi:amino acid adenylation domain-containing protein
MNPTYERVRDQAARDPGRTSVIEAGRKHTYGEIAERAASAARELSGAGVGTGDLVAVSCTRRAPAIAGMLAAWSLGAAYLPMAPRLPRLRAELILDTARPRAVLTDGEDEFGAPRCEPRPGPARELDPAASYVIFTSGSTGTPKGVVLGHTGLDLLVRWYQGALGLNPGECSTQGADLGFDVSVMEIWGTLTIGAHLAVPSLDDLLEPAALRDFLIEHEVTAGFVPTGLAPGLLDLPWPERTTVRTLAAGGDRLTRWPEPRHPFRMLNAYGPTECTVVATAAELDPAVAAGLPPIGRALPHVEAAVIGPDGRPVAEGRTGELWLSGPAVALGYLGQARSDDVFVTADPGDGPRRWYRTGDLVHAENGALHYEGRRDEQVQINGRRTEPAEIVQAILGLPHVTDAVVFTRETAAGDVRLVAAVTPETVTRGEVQRHLRQIFPLFMIPSEVLPLPALPMTSNGKCDLARLRSEEATPR